MIKPYFGEFLVHPALLELSFYGCSYQCSYCFAKSRGAGVSAANSLKNLVGLLSGKFGRRVDGSQTLSSALLSRNAVTLLSNRSDPLSPGIAEMSCQAVDALAAFKKPFTVQTKGGDPETIKHFLRAMSSAGYGESIWYVTVETDSDKIRKKIAPQAPPLSVRLANIRQLVAAGQCVLVGINPYDTQFTKDNYKGLLRKLRDLGVHGIWAELLHISHDARKRLTEGQVDALGGVSYLDRLGNYSVRAVDYDRLDGMYTMLNYARSLGFATYTHGQTLASDFFTPFYKRFSPAQVCPINQQFLNYVLADPSDDDITYAMYEDFMLAGGALPDGRYPLESYIATINREFLKSGDRLSGSPKVLLKYFWNRCTHKTITGNYAFDDVGDPDTGVRDLDPEGNIIVRLAEDRLDHYSGGYDTATKVSGGKVG